MRISSWRLLLTLLASTIFLFSIANGALSGPGATTRVSISNAGAQGDSGSYNPAISADGNNVVFSSLSSNLVSNDTNGASDVFIRNTQANTTTRISTSWLNGQGNYASYNPDISADGRYVVFQSISSNLVPGDTNNAVDVFLKELETGMTLRVSTDSYGNEGNGSFSMGPASFDPSVSADGRYVAFSSYASNLVPDDTSGVGADIFIKDTLTGETSLVSMDSAGVQGNNHSYYPDISDDGNYVAFYSFASNLVPGDTNDAADIFVLDLQFGDVTRASTATDGTQQNASVDGNAPSISSDGHYVAFCSYASNLVTGDLNNDADVFIKDILTGNTAIATTDAGEIPGSGGSYSPTISADGRFIAFWSGADNFVSTDINGTVDAFVKDTQDGNVILVSTDSSGGAGHGDWPGSSVGSPVISTGGGKVDVAFASTFADLVPEDNNGSLDVFVKETGLTGPTCVPFKPYLGAIVYPAFWSSYADYLARDLTISTIFINYGIDPAYAVTVTEVSCTDGVMISTQMPFNMGDLEGNTGALLNIVYNVPAGVYLFNANLTAQATNACGVTYTY